MACLKMQTSGESHGKCLIAIVCGFPAGVEVTEDEINQELKRRQGGYGRGGRMTIEKDKVELLSGIRHGYSLGSPISMKIENRDWKNWVHYMQAEKEGADEGRNVTKPRPGHADLPGALKFNQLDIRNVLERSSARETASRVAVGALCKILLRNFNINLFSYVVEIGGVSQPAGDLSFEEIQQRAEASPVRMVNPDAEKKAIAIIDKAKADGDSIGGIWEVIATGVPAGLGSCMDWDEKLDGRLAQALMSIQATKGVEIGMGFNTARKPGSHVHDPINYSKDANDYLPGHGQAGYFFHESNNAGGIVGGMTTGEAIVVRAVTKPIPTLMKPLMSVDISSKERFEAARERSDVCTVPAAGVIGESVVAFVLAQAFLDKFGGDCLEEIKRNYTSYIDYLKEF